MKIHLIYDDYGLGWFGNSLKNVEFCSADFCAFFGCERKDTILIVSEESFDGSFLVTRVGSQIIHCNETFDILTGAMKFAATHFPKTFYVGIE